jgi:hypothetical protein
MVVKIRLSVTLYAFTGDDGTFPRYTCDEAMARLHNKPKKADPRNCIVKGEGKPGQRLLRT